MKKRIVLFLAAMFLFFSFDILPIGLSIKAEGNNASFGEFSARAVIPANQVDTQQSYFDLRLDAGEKQRIKLKITNKSDDYITAYIKLNQATTGRNGVISYNTANNEDKSLEVLLKEVVRVTQERVRVKPNSVRYVDVDINMPEKTFDGTVLGGFVVTAEKDNLEEKSKSTDEIQITNQYAYTVGLKLTQNNKAVQPDFNLLEIKPGLVNYSTSVSVKLQNSEAVIVKGMDIDARIYRGKEKEVYRETLLRGVEAAPNSNFDVVVDWKDQRLQSGKYRLKMIVKHEGQIWEWDKEFRIDSGTVNSVNKEALNVENHSNLIQILAFVIILLIVAIIAYFIGTMTRKKHYHNTDEG